MEEKGKRKKTRIAVVLESRIQINTTKDAFIAC